MRGAGFRLGQRLGPTSPGGALGVLGPELQVVVEEGWEAGARRQGWR